MAAVVVPEVKESIFLIRLQEDVQYLHKVILFQLVAEVAELEWKVQEVMVLLVQD